MKGEPIERKMPAITPGARKTIHGTVTVAVRAAVDATGKISDVSFKSEGRASISQRLLLRRREVGCSSRRRRMGRR